VGSAAFEGCSALVEVLLPDSLVKVRVSTFSGCSGLTNVSLPNALGTIGVNAFRHCSRLTDVTLPRSLVAVGAFSFAACSRLRNVNFASNAQLQSIAAGGFCGCTRLLELELPSLVHTIGGRGDGSQDRGAFEGCTNLRTLILPPALTTLGAAAFAGSTSKLRMVVVSTAAPEAVAATVATMLGRRSDQTSLISGSDNPRANELLLNVAAVSSVQLVSAPDVVVAALGGVFSGMTTMAEVRAAHRDIPSLLDHRYWTVMTHKHGICTPSQQACARMVLMVGARLDSPSAPYSGLASTAAAAPGIQLPPLPDELWMEVLSWLRRSELGERTM
jgi:hypothetical protein